MRKRLLALEMPAARLSADRARRGAVIAPLAKDTATGRLQRSRQVISASPPPVLLLPPTATPGCPR